MPLIIPNNLPAKAVLNEENIFTMEEGRAMSQDIRPLDIVIVNLMPTKVATETQLARVLANTPLQVDLTLIHMDSHESKNVSQSHLAKFYKTWEEIKDKKFDGMILTGAPVEQIEFEAVDYWSELEKIIKWSETHVFSTLHICWGAQAGLYSRYRIKKHLTGDKVFGVFEQKVTRPKNPLMRGFDEYFYAPHSRHTYVETKDIENTKELRILAESEEAGVHIAATDNGKEIYVLGHQEYDKETLELEYKRDLDRGLEIEPPKNYYKNNDPKSEIMFRWRSHASLLFTNWLNYYVYQETPFDKGSNEFETKKD